MTNNDHEYKHIDVDISYNFVADMKKAIKDNDLALCEMLLEEWILIVESYKEYD
jgi:hypothetical protein